MNQLKISVLLLSIACQAPSQSKSPETKTAAEPKAELVWNSRAYPTGNRATSSLLVERQTPAEVQAGQRYEYKIRLTNLTAMPLVNVIVTDTAPAGFEVPEGAPSAELAAGKVAWRIDTLDGRASVVLSASALASAPGEFLHTANVTYEAPVTSVTMIVQPKLELERQVVEAVVLVDGVMVTYVIRNAGTGTAREVVIEETLMEGFVGDDGSDVIRIEVGALAAGESRTIARKVTCKNAGPFESSASASGFGGLGATTEKQLVRVTTPRLSATAEAPKRAAIGQIYILKLTVGNDGDGPARSTIANFTLPAGAIYVDSDAADGVQVNANHLSWNAGTIEAGKQATVAIRLRATAADVVEFDGSVNAHGADAMELKAAVEQFGIATIEIEVRDEVDPLQAGSDVVYIVSVRNQGTASATNIKLVCNLDEGMGLVDATGPSDGAAAGTQIVFEPVAELAPKATLSWRIVVSSSKEGDRRFRVEITTDQLDRPVEETESTRIFE